MQLQIRRTSENGKVYEPVAAEGGDEGGMCPAAVTRGSISNKIKRFRPVYGHLNALQLSISVHQRYSVTFKMTKFVFGTDIQH